LSLRAALPLDFDRIKVIFDTSSMGSLALNSHILTIQLIALQTASIALTLTLNTFALNKSTLRRFEKVDYTTCPIVQFFMNNPCVSLPSYAVLLVLARFRFFTKPIISVKVLFPFQRTYYLRTLWKRRTHSTVPNSVYTSWLNKGLTQTFLYFYDNKFMLNRVSLFASPQSIYANRCTGAKL